MSLYHTDPCLFFHSLCNLQTSKSTLPSQYDKKDLNSTLIISLLHDRQVVNCCIVHMRLGKLINLLPCMPTLGLPSFILLSQTVEEMESFSPWSLSNVSLSSIWSGVTNDALWPTSNIQGESPTLGHLPK
jgi:hypothetical protein